MSLPPELITFFSAMLPVSELRGAIPFAIQVLGLKPLNAFFWGVMGNIIPIFFILATLKPASEFLMKKSKFFHTLFSKIFEKTRHKYSKKIEELGLIALFVFVAIPLPGSGSWTGSLIAFLFGIPYWRAFSAISAGIVASGIIVTIGFTSIIRLIEKTISFF